MPEVDDREGVKGVMVALYDFQGRKEDEISFYRGDLVYLMSDLDETGWALGKVKPRRRPSSAEYDDQRLGLFPVEFVRPATAEEERLCGEDASCERIRSNSGATKNSSPLQSLDDEDEDDGLLPPLPSSDDSFTVPSESSSGASSLRITQNGAQGWLHLKHSNKKMWQRRHFILNNDSLMYYKKENTSRVDKKPLGKISVDQAWLEASPSVDEKLKKDHCILMKTSSGEKYYVHAETKDDFYGWLSAFSSCAAIAGIRRT